MKIIHSKQYEKTLTPAGWHDKLDEAMVTFNSRNHADITSEDGFKAIMSNESSREQYNDLVSSLVENDEQTRQLVKDVARHTMKDVRDNFRSHEAADALANNANYNSLAKLNSWVIVGYTARSKAMEMFHTFTSDDPTVEFEYTLNYTVKGNDTKQYYRPMADRDGDLAFMYDLPQLLPLDNDTFLNKMPNLEKFDELESTNGGSKVWIKVTGGVTGNLFTDANNGYDRTKFTLEKNPMISGIIYSIPNPEDEDAPFTGMVPVYFDRYDGFGEQQIKHFHNAVDIPYNNGAASAHAEIYGQIDLDSGDYSFSPVGAITHIQLDTRLTNVANELGSIRSGSKKIVESFAVDNHPYATVPVAPEVSDDFNIAGEGVSAVAYWTDKSTSALANMRDCVFEEKLDKAYNKPIEQFKLYPMLGGWKNAFDFPVTARLAGGNDPLSWMKTGVKFSIINHLLGSERTTYFEDDTQRQWYLLGYEQDTNLIPDVTYTNWDGSEGGVGGKSEKYGFGINGRAGFVDSEDRHVRVIGSTYNRHYINKKTGKRVPMRGVLKSLSLEQPTTVYLPYSFRVYSGISPEYGNRTGIIISCRDSINILSGVQTRITFSDNDDNWYRNMVENNKSQALSFPEGTSKLTIEAE